MNNDIYSSRNRNNSPHALSVSELNEFLKKTIDNNSFLKNVYVKGEISNFKNHYSTGNFYFTIKDENSQIKAVMFKANAQKIRFVPEDGMNVTLHGYISVFVRDGNFQFYCTSMEPDGVGSLYIAFEQLKQKLADEGLFDESRKKPLPKIPTRIGVVTSATGAVIQDIRNVLGRRFPLAEIILYPTLVQGDGAAKQLCDGIRYFNRVKSVDVIIIGRGGGSLEDLWAFNDEGLARTIASSELPVISAVGHEVDFTICDFVSDVRAPTPSAAAELAVPDRETLKKQISNILSREARIISKKVSGYRQTIDRIAKSQVITKPWSFVDEKRLMLDQLADAVYKEESFALEKKRNLLSVNAGKLDALNPLAVLSRGYSAVFKQDGKLIKSIDDIEVGDKVSFKTGDGHALCEVMSKEKD